MPTIFLFIPPVAYSMRMDLDCSIELFLKKTLHLKREKCSGIGGHSKIRLTGLAAGNVAGKKLPRFVTGKL